MSDYNRFDPLKFPPSYQDARMLDYGKLSQPQRPAQFAVCDCGDPACSVGPAETYAAYRRGEITESDRQRMIAERRNPATVSSLSNAYAGAQSSNYDELRKAVKDWIIEAPAQHFSDIIGNEEALSLIRDAIRAPIDEADLYAAYGLSMPKGALLYGPPGCGKTMFARAAAHEMQQLYGTKEMISLGGADLQSKYVGETEKRISSIFAYARAYKQRHGHPLLVFIDEAEVLFPDRTGRTRPVAPWEQSQVATFLAEMDGIQASGAFVLLATNRPEAIDSAVLRDGRCDFKIEVKRPTQEAIEAILTKTFAGIFTQVEESSLVFAALEAFYAPHRVILDLNDLVSSMEDWFAARGIQINDEHSLAKLRILRRQRFTFDMIVSGAMAASVATRAKRIAFSRDRKNATRLGVTIDDVLAAVGGIFDENKKLDHSYAMKEFLEEVDAELKELAA